MVHTSYNSLRTEQHPIIQNLADTIETAWHSLLDCSPLAPPQDLGYIEGALEGEQLVIENHCYQAPQFRKLHIELAKVGSGLDILHCVMFPRPAFHLPIFGLDIVAGKTQISAAIVDLSPVTADRQLPQAYRDSLERLPSPKFKQPRDLPMWGDIFSDRCLFIRPTDATEARMFLTQAVRYLTLHCQIASKTQPIQSIDKQTALLARQRHYCLQQQKNDKTRRILARAFGKAWADQYLKTMLFDCLAD